MSQNRKYKSFSIREKIAVIEEVERKQKPKKVIANEYGIPVSTLSTWLKNKDKLSNENVTETQKRIREPSFSKVDEAVLKWFVEARHKKISLDGLIIKAQAEKFAKLLGENKFKASDGWFKNWKKRNNIVLKNTAGESGSVDYESAAAWMQSLDPILNEYEPKNIFNADETGLFFKCTPEKTYMFKGDSCFGGKKSKERVTILAAVNMVRLSL